MSKSKIGVCKNPSSFHSLMTEAINIQTSNRYSEIFRTNVTELLQHAATLSRAIHLYQNLCISPSASFIQLVIYESFGDRHQAHTHTHRHKNIIPCLIFQL